MRTHKESAHANRGPLFHPALIIGQPFPGIPLFGSKSRNFYLFNSASFGPNSLSNFSKNAFTSSDVR
jgi:hypothetical protein